LLDPDTAKFVAELCAGDPSIRHVEVSFVQGDMSRKRTAGALASRAPILAFIDDDVAVPVMWADRLLEAFADPDVGLVSGPSLIPHDLALMPRLAGLALSSAAAGNVSCRYIGGNQPPRPCRWSGVIGCNMAFRRNVLEQIEFFDPRFGPGDDLLAGHKVTSAGFRVALAPAAGLLHYPRSSLSGFVRQIFGYGATRVRLIRFGVPMELAPLVPMIWVVTIALLGCLGLLFSEALIVLGVLLAAYMLFVLGVVVQVTWRSHRMVDALVAMVIPVMHLSYGLGCWVEFVRPNKDLSEKPVGA
jgi:GT2 family glycosyltransferase